MRVRIRQDARQSYGDRWIVEVMPWWSLTWFYVECYSGKDNPKNLALSHAIQLKRPIVEEIE